MITYKDEMEAKSGIDELVTVFKSNPSLFKYIIKGLDPRHRVTRDLQQTITEHSFEDPELIESAALKLFTGIIDENMKLEELNYSPSELATYFGVSRQTINKWINANRFTGTPRSIERKHARINENEYFIFPHGEWQQVKEIIAKYNTNHQELTKDDERKEIEKELYYLDKQYGGNLSTYMEENKKLLNEKEQSDLEEWKFFQDHYRKLSE